MRAPLDDACSPSPASITPAFTSSSLNLPISARSACVGRTPASESLLAFTSTTNRIALSLSRGHVCSASHLGAELPCQTPPRADPMLVGLPRRHAGGDRANPKQQPS